MTKVALLDRDGTIHHERGYISDPNEIELVEGSVEAIAALKRAGFIVVVVTNQAGIAKGITSREEVEAVNAHVVELLRSQSADALVDLVVYCPHRPEDNCDCRKPKTGMLEEVENRWSVSWGESWIVGDKLSDLELGVNAGLPRAHCLLVRTGHGAEQEQAVQDAFGEEAVFDRLALATTHILGNST